jgi:hypothetical protein
MSYDLYLSSPTLTREAFAKYFSGRKRYNDAAFYANEDTGVYFSFEFFQPDQSEDPETPELLRSAHVAFNMNFFRPHAFALEAEPEVTALIAAFDCAIFDPQMEGAGDGAYSRESFFKGWNTGNAFGYRAIAGERGAGDALVADDGLIERVWLWNYNRAGAQQAFGEAAFLPRISWAKSKRDGGAVTYGVWGEGVLMAFPECASHALLAREKRGFFAGKGMEAKLVPLDEVARWPGCAWRDTPQGRLLLAPERAPPSAQVLKSFTGSFAGLEAAAKPVAFDHVLNASLIAQARG